MVDLPYPTTRTFDGLVCSLDEPGFEKPLNYGIIAQSTKEVQDIENAPAISMGPYLIESGQIHLLTNISIYSQRGENQDQLRLLYMNDVAFRIWKAMGKEPNLIGVQHRPPKTASLAFGVPFSE